MRPYRKLLPPDALPALLSIGIICLNGLILLSNNDWAPTYVLCLAIVPCAALLLISNFSLAPLTSIVALGAAVYCGSMILSEVIRAELPLPDVLSELRPASLIFVYLISFRLISPTPGALATVLYMTIALAGISSAINAIAFLGSGVHIGAIAENRLVPVLGTPSYQGSTTVSTTYAVYFAGAFTAIVTAKRPAWQQLALALAAFSLLIGLILTQARSGYLAILAGVLTVAISLSRRARIFTMCFLGAVALLALYPPFTEALLARGLSYRNDIWVSYLMMASGRPLFGYGALANVHQMVDGFEFFHAHNLFLSAEIRGGVLGVASLLTMVIAAIHAGAAHLRRTGSPAILAMVVTLATAGLFDYELLISFPNWIWITFWLPFGLAAGVEARPRTDTGNLLPARVAIAKTVE